MGQNTRHASFAGAMRAGKQIGMADFAAFERVLQRSQYAPARQVRTASSAIFTVQRNSPLALL